MGASNAPNAPMMGHITGGIRHPMMPPMSYFDTLVEKLDNLSTSNIHIYPSTLEICINNLLKPIFFGSGLPPPPDPTRDDATPPENHTKTNIFTYSQCLDYISNQMH